MKLILTILIFGIAFVPFIFLIYEISEDMRTEQFKKKKYKIQDEMNMFNDVMWIKKVIKSCKTYIQLTNANKLRYILEDKYKNKVDHNLLDRMFNDLYWDWEGMTDQVTYD